MKNWKPRIKSSQMTMEHSLPLSNKWSGQKAEPVTAPHQYSFQTESKHSGPTGAMKTGIIQNAVPWRAREQSSLPTFVIRMRYLSSKAWLSWQPANSCHTSALRASGTPLFTRVESPFGRAPRLLCLETKDKKTKQSDCLHHCRAAAVTGSLSVSLSKSVSLVKRSVRRGAWNHRA